MPDPKTTAALSKSEAREALDHERDAILADISDDQSERWRTGHHYANILEQNLAVLAGHKSAVEFVNLELAPKAKAISKSGLLLYARVARAFDEPTTTKYGTSALDKLLTLRALLDLKEPPANLATFRVRTLDKQGKPVERPFPECSVAELSAAIRLLKAPPPEHLDKDAVAAAKSLQAVVDMKLGEDSPFEVKLEQRGRQLYLNFRLIPIERLEEVLKACLGQS
ncbi:MAG TPA: hypothetical protein VGK67_05395 [Myxococcales bacterium]|jgi:hypothetical protein